MSYEKVRDGGTVLVMLGEDVKAIFTSEVLADAWIRDNPAPAELALSVADFDESKHPRWPKGTPAGKGGKFREVADLFDLVKNSISGSFRFKDGSTTYEVRRHLGTVTAFKVGSGGNLGRPIPLHKDDTWQAFLVRMDGRSTDADAINAGWPDKHAAAWLNSGREKFSDAAVKKAADKMEKTGFNADEVAKVRALGSTEQSAADEMARNRQIRADREKEARANANPKLSEFDRLIKPRMKDPQSADFYSQIDYAGLAEDNGVSEDEIVRAVASMTGADFNTTEKGATRDEDIGHVTLGGSGRRTKLDMGEWDRATFDALIEDASGGRRPSGSPERKHYADREKEASMSEFDRLIKPRMKDPDSADLYSQIDYAGLAEDNGVSEDVIAVAIATMKDARFEETDTPAAIDDDIGRVMIGKLDMGEWDRTTFDTLVQDAKANKRGNGKPAVVVEDVDIMNERISNPYKLEEGLNARFKRVRFKLVKERGPGGGNPTFNIEGAPADVAKALQRLGYDKGDFAEMFPELAKALKA